MEAGKTNFKSRKETLGYVAEIKISYSNKISSKERPKITQSDDAIKIFHETWEEGTIGLYETFKILLLNRVNKVLGVFTVSKGGISGTIVDSKIIFATALKAAACSIILCHNHPSGNLKPSQQDNIITKKLVDGGRLLDIQVLDHLIISDDFNEFWSFADKNMM